MSRQLQTQAQADDRANDRAAMTPHSHWILGTIVMLVCGICCVPTLACTIPAMLLADCVSYCIDNREGGGQGLETRI